MDKSWITSGGGVSSFPFLRGFTGFLDFAFHHNNGGIEINCPCRKCLNRFYGDRDSVFKHVICDGFDSNYIVWTNHGESINSVNNNEREEYNRGDDMIGMLHDSFEFPHDGDDAFEFPHDGFTGSGPNAETDKFYKLLEDAERELYPGCTKFTSLSFLVRLLHFKVLDGWSDKSFTNLLILLKEAFPDGETLPDSYYKAKKFRQTLGFNYVKIDACPNDCMLYWKEKENLEACDICHETRYKDEGNEGDANPKRKRIAKKQMRYFPLKPRLRRMFMSSKTALKMRWHAEEHEDDGIQRHPADSEAWKKFDQKHKEFALDRRNVRLGLASDGFNPYRTMNITHSTWPVVLINLNNPPCSIMKQASFMLSILIDGPKAPGNDLDVYLQPLIEELNEYWVDGVETFDAATGFMFHLRAALMWTISDFPAYANLSGWSTKGALACPSCNKETDSRWLKHGRKFCYTGHRRFLPQNHKFRKDKNNFYDKVEDRPMPPKLSGEDILKQVEHIENRFGKGPATQKRKRSTGGSDFSESIPSYNWKKKSIFFDLPYWKDHLIRHNLDVMHIEKNVCECILNTLLDMDKRSKDNLSARRDLQEMRIRKSLHPVPRGNGKYELPPAAFTMTKDEQTAFCKVLKDVKVPDNYSSNISRCVDVKKRTIKGLKSHDCHILMQQLLPIALRKVLPKNVAKPLIELCGFFRRLCSKVMTVSEIDSMQEEIKITLCHLEKIFPPSLFDIMMHLPIHLAEEARIAGLVCFRWMYPIERYLLTLKQYVRQRNFPEGSIAEGYLAEECLTFCSRYLDDAVETKLTRPARYHDGGNGKQERFILTELEREQAHRYVLANTNSIIPFQDMHIEFLRKTRQRKMSAHQLKKIHNAEFPTWLFNYVQESGDTTIPEEVKVISRGPDTWATRYAKGYTVNGLKFHILSYGDRLKSQNTGVMVRASTDSYASVKDNRPISGDVKYYGKLTEVIELTYSMDIKFDMFKCIWVDDTNGVKEDEYKFTVVNFNHLMYKNNDISAEPYIFASQAQQVWYVKDPIEHDWSVVVKMTPRDFYDIYSKDPSTSLITCPQAEPYQNQNMDDVEANIDDDTTWARQDISGVVVLDDHNVNVSTDFIDDDIDGDVYGGIGDNVDISEGGKSDEDEGDEDDRDFESDEDEVDEDEDDDDDSDYN